MMNMKDLSLALGVYIRPKRAALCGVCWVLSAFAAFAGEWPKYTKTTTFELNGGSGGPGTLDITYRQLPLDTGAEVYSPLSVPRASREGSAFLGYFGIYRTLVVGETEDKEFMVFDAAGNKTGLMSGSLAEFAPGTLYAKWGMKAVRNGPQLVPDYDRDGKIDEMDRAKALSSDEFTIWINDDDDAAGAEADDGKGDTNSDLHDVPGGEGNGKDCEDGKVNGRCDLLDFFPVLVDVYEVSDWNTMTWKLCSDSVNAVCTGLKADRAGSFHTQEVKALDGETSLYGASVMKLTEDGVELPSGFLDQDGKGVLVIEGRKQGMWCLTLRGYKNDEVVAEVSMNLSVEPVEDMYGWMNLRDEVKDEGEGEQWKVENSTVHLNSSPSPDNRHFILVHGYNTNHEEARGNAAEFYKKLWQSGSDAMFTAVEWYGDQSQMRFEILGVTFSPNYFANVENAFAAARPFAEACALLPGEKILVGHSLGNMLISSAIKDYGLDYTKYVMLNAAVAREAYDASAYDPDMISVLWDDAEEDGSDRASRWYRNFADHKYDPRDYRRKLAWRGRFANLPRTVNYYSPTDNLLANPANDDPDDFDETKEGDPKLVRELLEKTISIGGFWALSEKLKGRPTLIETINGVLTNVFGMAESDAYKCEGGWGENENYVEGLPFNPANTRFTPFLDERLKTQGMPDILPAETERLRAQHLADAIPAESFAAGANPVATLENVNEESFIGENPDWPVGEVVEEIGGGGQWKNEWKHSTFREVAFYHTSKLYASLAAVGKPRVIIDTDLGSCMDDLFAVDFAARMHWVGKLDLMAVMMNRPDGSDPEGRGEFLAFADCYLNALGFGKDFPLGKSEPLTKPESRPAVINPYWTLVHSNDVSSTRFKPSGRDLTAVSDAVALYRSLLEDAPDKSVVICATGFFNNLSKLLAECPDLVGRKVKELRIMGGCFDGSVERDRNGKGEYNVEGDIPSAARIFEDWPTPIIVTPWEVGMKLGEYRPADVLEDFPSGAFNPTVRAVYERWPNPPAGYMNRLWDPMTALSLTEGVALAPLSEKGGISVDDNGVTTFTPDPSSNRCYQVASKMDATTVVNRFREICRTGNPAEPAKGTEANPWIISEEDDFGEVRAYMLSETELCIEGDGITMLDFGGCGPWGENVRSVYFDNPPQNISPNAFLGCTNLCAVTAEGEATFGQWLKLKDSGFFNQPGVDQAQVKWFDLEKSDPVELISANYANGRVEVRCVVYDKNAALNACGSNVKLGLSVSIMGEEKEVRHLHRVENGGIEYDDMMLWLKKDGRPKFVTLIWDAELDLTPEELAELDLRDIRVNGTNCADALVTVRNGEFVGVLDEETKVRAWKGIPYAAQPTGANRWKVMGDPEPSGETFTAKQFGHAAIQLLDPTETGGYVEQGDDCLVLNVWSTDPSVEVGCDWGKRPVMVYIHGGGFLMGGSADIHYDGRNIVERNKDVVVVTINYRVGLLGYIDLKNVPGGEAFADSPNLATLDQRQALKWVRDNIAAFGGDRDNVTIFGESAGGASVAVHLTSPESAPYFRRAIQMSGALDFTMTEKAYEERQLTERLVAAVAELRFGNVALSNRVDMAVLQSLTPDEIRALMMTPYADLENPGLELAPDDLSCVPGIGAIWNYPMCGPRGVVPVDPFKAFETNGVSNGKDYMVGTVRDEMRYFTDYDGPDDPLRSYYTGFLSDRMRQNRYWFGGYAGLIDEFLDDYEGDGVRDEMDTRYPGIWKKTALEDMLFFRMAAIRMADIHAGLAADSQSGTKGKTYMYRFDKGREYADRPWAGAGHACELDYFFHNTSCVVDGPIDEGLADKANAAFVNFARCGDPNGAKSEEGGVKSEEFWEEYDATDRKTMLFKNDCTTSCVNDPDKTYYEFLKPAYDTYYSGRSNAERRTKTGLAFVREPEPPAGTADDPWQVGRTAGDEVIAYTNAAGRLFVEGTGDIRDFYALGGGLWFGETTVGAEFGAGVTSIGANMLSTCGELERIVMYAEEPPTLGDNALPPAWQLEAIYVPEDSYSAYVDAWPEYEDVIQGAVPGSEEKPWKIGASASDTVTAYTNGTGRLCIVGEGAMVGFDGSAPWTGLNVMECLVAAGVTEIGKSAFAECPTLGTLVLYAETPPALGEDNLSDVTIFVPAGAADDYRAVWPSKLGDQIDEMHSARGANIEKHLYEVEYKWWNADRANDVAEALVAFVDTLDWLEEIRRRFFPYEFFDWYEGVANRALCTSCRNGNFIGRNFDWGYDDVDECVMRVPAAEGRLASVGVASRFFPQALQDAFDVDDFLPELTMDGINEKGVAINVNVVPGGDNGWTTGTNHGAKRLCAGFAVRTVLDRATNAAHAVEILQSRDIYSLKPLEFHWMISDADESYVVECANNQLVVLKAKNARPKMANFYVSHSPNVAEYEVVSGNEELTASVHTPHAMGIERYANVSNGLESVGSVEAMFSRMTNVWYKAKYLPGNEEKFWSDLNGSPVPGMGEERFEVGDDLLYGELRLEAFEAIQANYAAVMDYEARWGNRDTLEHDPTLTNQVVHTVHTSIYDLERRELTVCVQEDVRTRRVFALAGPLAPEGSKENPWQVGTEGREAEVTAWTNGTGTLVVEGTGAVGWAPWAEDADGITELVKDKGVTGLDGIMSTLPALMTVNGLTLDELVVAGMVGAAKAGFSAIAVEGGFAQLGVVVSTNGDLTAATESWGKAKVEKAEAVGGEAILTIPAPAEKGFFILNPRQDVPSDATIRIKPGAITTVK